MRHRESSTLLPIKEPKLEYDEIVIKDEDLGDLNLELPLDVSLESDEEVKGENDCEDMLDDESLQIESPRSSLQQSPSPKYIRKSRRKPLQPQKTHRDELLNIQINTSEMLKLEEKDNDDDDDDDDDSLYGIQIIKNSDPIQFTNNDNYYKQTSNDNEEQHENVYNDEAKEDCEEDEDSADEPPDMETDDVFKGIQEEADGGELDEEMKKNVKEEWRAYWGVKCNICNCIFTFRSHFDRHYRSKHNTKPIYTCSYCNKSVEKYSTFRSHCYRHITEGRYRCSYCNKGFSLRSLLTVHIIGHHTPVKPYICEECGKGFVTKAGLNIHLRKHQSNQKDDFPCAECGKVLHTRGGLTAHMNVHRLGRRFMCDVCGKTFTQKVNMQQHVKQHTGERPFECDQCGKKFAEKSHLTRHNSFHSNVRPFKCPVCNKMYKTERCLKVHSLVHAESRPHVCEYCNKGFLSTTKLKQHHNIHTGERPFKCKYCERTFTNYPNWLKHTRRRHKVDHKTGLGLQPKQEKDNSIAPSINEDISAVNEIIPQPLVDDQFVFSEQIMIDYSKLTENGLLTNTLPVVEDSKLNLHSQMMLEDSKVNVHSQMIPQQTSDIPSANFPSVNSVSLLLPYQQHTNFFEPYPAHQNQFIIQPSYIQEEPHPAHQQQHQMIYQEHVHLLHAQHLLQM